MKPIGWTNWNRSKLTRLRWLWVGLLLAASLPVPADLVAQQTSPTRLQIDTARIRAAGLRLLEGRHVTLITDVRDRDDIDEFAAVFDQAVPQWCAYFGVAQRQAESWKTIGCVIADKSRFQRAGLLPDDLPLFPAGYQRSGDMWLFVQPGDYYTRHLLLHEGTHAFMERFLRGYGPPWYAEGMAELLAVHSWSAGQLTLKTRIRDRAQVPFWGRVKIIRHDRQNDATMSLAEVMDTPNKSFQKVRYYAWAWAACEFFDTHPDYQAPFRQLQRRADAPHDQFNRDFKLQLAAQWPSVEKQWEWMVEEIEYGYDVARAKPVDVLSKRTDEGWIELTVSAERGWQATGIEVVAEQLYQIRAAGEYQIKKDEQPWICQPGGVTIEYYRGRPLGQLIASVKSEEDAPQTVTLGNGGEIRFAQSGELLSSRQRVAGPLGRQSRRIERSPEGAPRRTLMTASD